MSNRLNLEENLREEKKTLICLDKTVLPLRYHVCSTFKTLLEQIQWRKPYKSTSLNVKCGKLCNNTHVQYNT